MEEDNLWGELPSIDDIKTPLSLLKEQAAVLSKISNRLIEGKIMMPQSGPGRIVAGLMIVAPTLSGFQVEIVRIMHGLELYPVTVTNIHAETNTLAQDQDAFLEVLKSILQSEKTKKIIASLLVQIQGAGSDKK